ncbi:regulatory protein RecX [Micrococcales bacterium 31B]|nr:regulatory protein RecX [Micrococcales bacterium 31B]
MSTQSTPKPIEGAQEGAPNDDLKRAKQVALRYLGPKQRTRAEIRGTLERRGFAPELQQHVEEWLDQHALLDDIEYARAWVRARSVRKGMAPRALAQELQRKGVARGDIETAMEEYDADGSEQAAETHVLHALGSWDGVDLDHLERIKRRMFAALQRRGHGMGSAQRLVLRAIERHRSECCG